MLLKESKVDTKPITKTYVTHLRVNKNQFIISLCIIMLFTNTSVVIYLLKDWICYIRTVKLFEEIGQLTGI